MNKLDFLLALGECNEGMVSEAMTVAPPPSRPLSSPSRKRSLRRIASLCACAVLVLTAVNLALFLPFPTSAPSASGPYAAVLNHLSSSSGGYRSVADLLLSGTLDTAGALLFGGRGEGNVQTDSAGNIDPTDGTTEVTDNQISGVSEGDLLKRTATHAYYLSSTLYHDAALQVYRPEGDDLTLMGQYPLTSTLMELRLSYPDESALRSRFLYPKELLLTEDGRSLILICTDYRTTILLSFDLTDPDQPRHSGTHSISGNYETARLVNDRLVLITSSALSAFDPEVESSYLPMTGAGKEDSARPLPPEALLLPPKHDGIPAYTTLSLLDCHSLAEQDTVALYAPFAEAMITKERIYLACRTPRQEYLLKSYSLQNEASWVVGFDYTAGRLSPVGQITLEGEIGSQYHMDEKDGVLRVVTTLRRRAGAISDSGLFRPFLTEPGEVGVALFCVSLSDWTVAGKLMRFAPEGEEVKSVRFEGDTAYVCTATTETVVLDPVFFLDLSDPKAITVKESGTIPGFSHSLVELGDGLLLGIGRDEKASCFKAEVYAEGEEGVRILGSYLLDNSFFATDYKAYYIDRERDLLGLCYQSYGEDGLHSYYLLLQWREDGFAEVARREISSDLHSLPSTTRAFALGQQLCVISEAEAFVLPPV